MFSLKIQGGPQLAKALDSLGFTKQRAVLTNILKHGAEPYKTGMERHAPREPPAPDLAANIVIASVTRVSGTETLGSRSRNEGEAAVAVGPAKAFRGTDDASAKRSAIQPIALEYGTVKMGAQPFARPAFDEGSDEALKIIQDDIWAELRKQAGTSTTGRNL